MQSFIRPHPHRIPMWWRRGVTMTQANSRSPSRRQVLSGTPRKTLSIQMLKPSPLRPSSRVFSTGLFFLLLVSLSWKIPFGPTQRNIEFSCFLNKIKSCRKKNLLRGNEKFHSTLNRIFWIFLKDFLHNSYYYWPWLVRVSCSHFTSTSKYLLPWSISRLPT